MAILFVNWEKDIMEKMEETMKKRLYQALLGLVLSASVAVGGYDNYMNEVNTGKGIGMPKILKFYLKYILPLVILFIIIDGLI